ncbi:MAG: CDP-diacylglycerol--glycerol-3-phosphate 3-phosphatidyltransferase [Aeromonadales bacterium]|jgi:CDP-diacylglycerol--glycerol-3-phosphate 3-phosphatidyltransferase|nr:CDP-diacylglycerol--glycerol-3-phosphate 3-phosphatidyltransferase [Aeromonadales bacterium]MDY2890995.1 CDP-diacylglycerol--glycerol-3-phosphate 3-phosphatidyltransferase [Succinivibrio sp.]
MLNLPNVLTLVRLALIPVFVILFYWPTEISNLLAAIVFIAAALTDLLDGFLARKLKQTTKFGAFLDPVADKIIVCTALILIVEFYSVHVSEFFPHMNLFVSIPAMIIVAREITVSALREWMAELGKRSLVAVSWVGKWKTTIQLVSIAGLIWRYNDVIIYSALGMLAVATVLTIWSMVMYLKVGLMNMRENAAEAVKPPEAKP